MVHAFMLMGQSNMAGRGFVSEVPPIIDNRIRVLKNGRWQRMWEPVHADRRFAGVGPAASFAVSWLKDHPEEEIGLVPAAEGGSAIAEWLPGEALFEHAVSEAEFAARTGQIDGILWHQGETDTGEELSAEYYDRLCLMRREFCRRTGLSEVPFIIGGLGDYLSECEIFPDFRNYGRINGLLKKYTSKHDNTYFVTAEGLGCNPDRIHFSAESQRLFGMRYYAAYRDRMDITGPVEGETEVAAACAAYRGSSPEERKDTLLQLSRDGMINRQELDCLLAEL